MYVPYLFALLLAGYPFIVGVTGFFTDDTRIFSIVIRLFYFATVLLFFFLSIRKVNLANRQGGFWIYITAGTAYLTFYGTRVTSDLGSPFLYEEPLKISAIFFLATIPSFYFFTFRSIVPISFRVVNFLLVFLLVTTVALVCQFIFSGEFIPSEIKQGRVSTEKVNPITLGLVGAHLFILGVYCYYEKTMVRSCLLYTSPSPRDLSTSRMPSSA